MRKAEETRVKGRVQALGAQQISTLDKKIQAAIAESTVKTSKCF